jgi:hypothetical protein
MIAFWEFIHSSREFNPSFAHGIAQDPQRHCNVLKANQYNRLDGGGRWAHLQKQDKST